MDSKTAHISEGAVALEELDACDSLEGVAEYGNLDAPGAGGDNVPAGSLGASAASREIGQGQGGAGSRERLWSPLFVIVVAGTLCCFMVGQGLNSGTSVFIARMGGSTAFAGVLAAVFSAAAAAARIVCGPLVDRAGRLRVMVGGAALLLAGTLVPAVCSNDAVFVVCRIVQGVGFSAATTASATAAADVLPLSRLGEGIGYYGLGQALAMSIGPALALLLVATDAPDNLYFGLTGISLAVLALSLFCRYERNPQTLPETSVYRMRAEAKDADRKNSAASPDAGAAGAQAQASTANSDRIANATGNAPSGGEPAAANGQTVGGAATMAEEDPEPTGIRRTFEARALPGALPMVVLSPAFGFGIFFIGLYGTSLGIGNAGLFFTVSAVSMIAVRLKSDTYMDRIAPLKVFAAAVACGVIAYLLLLASEANGAFYYAAGFFYGICLGVSMPICQSVAVKNTPAERWGAANALYLLATDVGVGIATIVWGAVNDTFGFTTTIWCVIVCIELSLVVARLAFPREAREPHR